MQLSGKISSLIPDDGIRYICRNFVFDKLKMMCSVQNNTRSYSYCLLSFQ